MSSTRKTILVAGIGHFIKPELQKQFNSAPGDAQKGLDSIMPAAKEAGFDCEIIFLDPELVEPTMKAWREKLQSRAWDGVTIGFGIRGVREYTPLFEELVNVASTTVPGIRFGFSLAPDLVLETAHRMFPGMK